MCINSEIPDLHSEIAKLIRNFEEKSDIRVEKLKLDNRMRSTGTCNGYQILICVDSD